MKSDFMMLVVICFALSFLVGACDQGTPPSPAVDIVPYSSIPRPFSTSTYFLYGYALDQGEQSILDELTTRGIRLRDAWIPYGYGPCMMAFVNQMIVRLEYPDERIYSVGFVSDSSQVAPGICIETWKHYQFNK